MPIASSFKYPPPDTFVSPSPSRGEGMHRPWCDKILGTDCASRPSMTGGRGANSFGRSMIEMLGVLAIIGVLSVGGVAGYSKAMEQFKINKAVSQYNMLIFGMLEHLDSIKKENKGEIVGLLGLAKDLNLLPNSWQADERSEFLANYGSKALDNLGNTIQLFYVPNGYAGGAGRMVFSLYMGGLADGEDDSHSSAGFSKSFCLSVMNNVVQPLHDNLLWVNFQGYETNLYGDTYCQKTDKGKCLSSLKMSDINTMCSYCTKDNLCLLYLNF